MGVASINFRLWQKVVTRIGLTWNFARIKYFKSRVSVRMSFVNFVNVYFVALDERRSQLYYECGFINA